MENASDREGIGDKSMTGHLAYLVLLHFRDPRGFPNMARDYPPDPHDERTLIIRVGYSVNNMLSNTFPRIACLAPPGDSLAPSTLATRRRSIFAVLDHRVTCVDYKLLAADARCGWRQKLRNV